MSQWKEGQDLDPTSIRLFAGDPEERSKKKGRENSAAQQDDMGKEEFSEKGDGSPSEVHRHHDDADDDNNPSAEEKEEEEEATQRLHSEKEARILDACERRDIEDLQALAQSSGGFLTDELRRQACKSISTSSHPVC